MVYGNLTKGSQFRPRNGLFFRAMARCSQRCSPKIGDPADYPEGDSGSMLARTAEVNESDSPYGNARYFNFCSSSLTHSAVTANAENIAICPYVVYAYQLNDSPETTHIGYRKPAGVGDEASEGILREIEALLRSIVDEATY